MIKPYLFLQPSGQKGRGVFTREFIHANTIIEVAPVIVMDARDREFIDQTLLHDYIFEWGNQKSVAGIKADKCCMALGYIPMYNHSYKSNCEYFMDLDENTMQIKTVRKINPGEELTINYNGDWNDPKTLWFEAK